ncbi:cytochrome c oxidase subunit 2A [Sporosarcina saromensis]|uniref:Cytochrome c oxidase subunit 2A n=1 Tax=Sporosarcina saromensis TaxID=359365 RepID=A0ABU4GAE6_9BACL|nr:cytochrome c oxidase subunit 2A [Sporosarcina saromensis]MDW0112552.1 cytochrome c oxidase subunit 2A [Sporosarcina saromensis]
MTKDNSKQLVPSSNEHGMDLKGTFIAVMLLGIFILVSWFGIYALFLSR